jgi:type II secretory pathway component GspD/PulD (secretin)
MSANEGGNAILMTAKRSDIRRFTQIIQALDSSGNGDLEVYLLSYADSKSIAQELKDVFSPPDATQNAGANPFAIFGNRGRGAGGGGGAAAEDNPKRAAIKVNAVSDDQNNAVLVSAPIDIMPGISNIIFKLDQPQEDTVQIRVFHLVHCDPTDIVNELSSIFPDPTYLAAQQGRNGGGGQRGVATFGGAGFGARGGGGGGAATSSLSDRMKKQTTVYSVADARTQSVIVTASKDTMTQIEAMIDHLDQSGARIQQVFVYRPQFSDVLDMQSPLQDLFMSTTSRSSSSTQVNALTQRAQQAAQTSTLNTSGSSALSGGSSGGGKSGP